MKRVLFLSKPILVSFLLSCSTLMSNEDFSFSVREQDEIEILEELIFVTKKSLYEHETLLKEVKNYRFIREQFLNDPESAKWATALVKASIAINKLLKEGSLTHLFSSDFLTEVSFYSDVGKQYGLR